jgi:hypothetical protein
MIRNVSGYQNFSTLGVAIVLIVGSSLVILGLVIDVDVGLVQKLVFKKHYARLTWISDEYLQLQRLAYEGAGYINWEGCANDVPVSGRLERADQELGGLDISDIEHPRLVKFPPYPESSPDDGPPQKGVKLLDYQEVSPVPDN